MTLVRWATRYYCEAISLDDWETVPKSKLEDNKSVKW